jgi:hypothetical protein
MNSYLVVSNIFFEWLVNNSRNMHIRLEHDLAMTKGLTDPLPKSWLPNLTMYSSDPVEKVCVSMEIGYL